MPNTYGNRGPERAAIRTQFRLNPEMITVVVPLGNGLSAKFELHGDGWYFCKPILKYDENTGTSYYETVCAKCDQGVNMNRHPTCVNLDGNPDNIATCMFCACINDPTVYSCMTVGSDDCIEVDFGGHAYWE